MFRGYVQSTWLIFEEAKGNEIRFGGGEERKIWRIGKNEQALFVVTQV